MFAAASTQIALTDEEKSWITQHPVIKFTGDPDWLPFEGFTEEGKYIGIVSDYLKIVEQETSLKFDIIPSKSWSESISLLEKKRVDMLTVSDSWKDPEYLYTNPILPSPIVIVMTEGHRYVDSLYYLQYESIAVIKGYRYIENIKKKYPDYSFYEVENIQEGLEGVASGKYDALLASMALATYTIDKMQLSNLKVVGKTEFNIRVNFAINKTLAPLVGIINKVKIDEKKGHALLKEWTYQQYVEKTDYTLITQLLILLLIILMTATILYLLLKRKSQRHKSAEGLITITQKEIIDAAKYASILDRTRLLQSDTFHDFFDDSFNVSHPKTYKSGTFLHFDALDNDRALLILIDASGRSIDSILNAMVIKTVIETVLTQLKSQTLAFNPAALLGSMQREIQRMLETLDSKEKPDNRGFDAAVITLDKRENQLLFAGANIPLYYTLNHEVFTVRADKHAVDDENYTFTNHTVQLESTMDFYLLSSGYTDQIGGKQSLPFGKRRIKEILGKYDTHSMDVQKNALIKAFREYTGKQERVGDIALIGFRITAR